MAGRYQVVAAKYAHRLAVASKYFRCGGERRVKFFCLITKPQSKRHGVDG